MKQQIKLIFEIDKYPILFRFKYYIISKHDKYKQSNM